MTAFNFPSSTQRNNNVQSMPNRGRNANQAEERKPSEFWLNIGITLPLPTGENGALQEEFISLGGIPVDSIEEAVVRATSSANWATIGSAKNEVLRLIREDLAALTKGQAAVHPLLQVEARRAGEQAPVAAPTEVTNVVLAALRPQLAAAS